MYRENAAGLKALQNAFRHPSHSRVLEGYADEVLHAALALPRLAEVSVAEQRLNDELRRHNGGGSALGGSVLGSLPTHAPAPTNTALAKFSAPTLKRSDSLTDCAIKIRDGSIAIVSPEFDAALACAYGNLGRLELLRGNRPCISSDHGSSGGRGIESLRDLAMEEHTIALIDDFADRHGRQPNNSEVAWLNAQEVYARIRKGVKQTAASIATCCRCSWPNALPCHARPCGSCR